jgi:hypothetical protein
VEKKGTSWGVIIVCLIFIWPVGLFLLIRKLTTDKSALMSGKTGLLTGVGWFLIIVGGIGSLSLLYDGISGGTIVALVMLVGGILLLVKASQTKKTARKYRQYIDIVVNQNIRGIDSISAQVGIAYETVEKDLQEMIRIGYLKDAFIDRQNRQIAFSQPAFNPYAPLQAPLIGQAAPQMIATRCSGCGANNVVTVGRVTECEYCGNSITA